jgi:hypothetical protein
VADDSDVPSFTKTKFLSWSQYLSYYLLYGFLSVSIRSLSTADVVSLCLCVCVCLMTYTYEASNVVLEVREFMMFVIIFITRCQMSVISTKHSSCCNY